MDKKQLQYLLNLGLETGADFSELYIEDTTSNAMEMALGKVSNVSSSKFNKYCNCFLSILF